MSKMRATLCLFAVLSLAVGWRPARAGTLDLSTGLNASNNLITTYGQGDGHWTATDLGGGPAFVITPTGPNWWPGTGGADTGYAPNGPNSDWISDNAISAFNGPAPYSFNRTFDLTGVNLSTFSLSGSWSIADGGTLSLNGHVIGTLDLSANPWTKLWAFSVPAGSPFLNQGMNTLTLTVTESNQIYEAARLDMAPVASTVPEPASLLFVGTGVLGLAGMLRRKLLAR